MSTLKTPLDTLLNSTFKHPLNTQYQGGKKNPKLKTKQIQLNVTNKKIET
jgi:hypothetical protein